MVTATRTTFEHVWYQQSSSFDTWQHATLAELDRRQPAPQFVTIQCWATEQRDLNAPHLADFFLESDAKSDDEFRAMLAGFRRLVAYLIEDLGIPPEWIGLAYSGNRSIHCRINHAVFGAEPSPRLTYALKLWAADLARRFGLTLDLEIYTRARMWRQVGTFHPKGKRFKIPLDWRELTLSIDEIRALAEKPRPDPLPSESDPELVPAARDEFQVFMAEAMKPSRGRAAHQTLDLDRRIGEGHRNGYLYRRGCVLRRYAFSEGAIFAAIMVENEEVCDPPLPEHEVRQIAQSAASHDPSEVPDHPEEAEASARQDAQRLRRVIGARHDFTKSAPLTATQKDIALTIARTLPTLPKNERGEVRLCAATVAVAAGCSRGTVATLYQTVARAGIWTTRQVDERKNNRIQQATYIRLSESIRPTEDAILDAIRQAPVEQRPRGGARTKSITLRPAPVDDLLCPVHGDAGTKTEAATSCAVADCLNLHYLHRTVHHPAGWLGDDEPDPDDPLTFKFERQNERRNEANEADPDDSAGSPDAQKLTPKDVDSLTFKFERQDGDDLDVFGPVAVEDEDDDLSPLVADQIGDIIDAGDVRARILVYGSALNWPRRPLIPPDVVIPPGQTKWERFVADPNYSDVLIDVERLLAAEVQAQGGGA